MIFGPSLRLGSFYISNNWLAVSQPLSVRMGGQLQALLLLLLLCPVALLSEDEDDDYIQNNDDYIQEGEEEDDCDGGQGNLQGLTEEDIASHSIEIIKGIRQDVVLG